jgi:hypothetical protein
VHDNYRIFQGLNFKSLGTAPMVAGGYCWLNSWHSRAREIARRRAKERGRRGDSIPYFTYRGGGGASWWPNFAGEEGGGGSIPVLGGGASAQGWRHWSGAASRGGAWRGCRSRAGPRRAGVRGKGATALMMAAHRGRGEGRGGALHPGDWRRSSSR